MSNRKAYVLIQTEIGQAGSVVKALRSMPGVDSADLVVGPHDVITVLQGSDADAIAKMVVTGIQAVKGVHRTITYMVIAE
jgi:DNA-binding Lrp family transcriptional regulator